MNQLINKRILLGVSGSIAAYKSADLVRKLREQGAEVRVVMTHGAMQFITPLTLQALSGNPVRESLFDADAEAAMGHIELARWADTILVAPASADFLARLAIGRADDLLSAICLASEAPVIVTPAMNRLMWSNDATRANVKTLRKRGVSFLGPAEGEQACGETGEGRMLEPEQIVQQLAQSFESGALQGARVMVTAGPTREPIDPVRYITNRSSGKMGYAIARAAMEAGAEVTLVSGPVELPAPDGVECICVETAQQMHQAVIDRVQRCDIFIGTAAVADYRPGLQSVNKMKKTRDEVQLKLVKTPDILSAVAASVSAPFTVGFAAETDNVIEYARSKLHKKGLDMIAANHVGEGLGFDRDENALEVLWEGGNVSLPLCKKEKLARQLIKIISERFHAKDTAENTG
jgi:phosphopantothenoylcysteine decarboxylase/phosphopantothenate--cysteine ligase